jgi:myo-inositol-1-phosphate synthase
VSGPLGVFFAGALGDVATTAVAGAAAISRGIARPTGLTTALADFAGADLAPLGEIAFGGCDVRAGDLAANARALEAAGVLPPGLAEAVRGRLDEATARIGPGLLTGASEAVARMAAPERTRTLAPRAAIGAAREALERFRDQTRAERLVFVHLTSVEPRSEAAESLADEEALERFLDEAGERCPASLAYAVAAQDAGAAYINFTPCCGASPPAMRARAERLGLPHAGRDGKTGETLLKSVLAPLFAARNLEVLSWAGFNILGNRDGAVLSDARAREAKLRSKGSVLRSILGERLGTEHVGIEYVPSIGDWKTAWDHIHFEGFLGTRMTLELTWRASDSALAAPLVLDLARLADRAARAGMKGLVPGLACFFKDPLGTDEARFSAQLEMLARLAASFRSDGRGGL